MFFFFVFFLQKSWPSFSFTCLRSMKHLASHGNVWVSKRLLNSKPNRSWNGKKKPLAPLVFLFAGQTPGVWVCWADIYVLKWTPDLTFDTSQCRSGSDGVLQRKSKYTNMRVLVEVIKQIRAVLMPAGAVQTTAAPVTPYPCVCVWGLKSLYSFPLFPHFWGFKDGAQIFETQTLSVRVLNV